jgi:hypothetical protein|tara:strand:- start:134 stop:397 length:264 start_codon:yes stop_codon:yes gene_type:complete
MSAFNENDFLEELEDSIKIESPEDVWEFVNYEIDRECIYNSNCFAIVKALNITDWSNSEFGEITNIQTLAFSSLYEFVSENITIPAE